MFMWMTFENSYYLGTDPFSFHKFVNMKKDYFRWTILLQMGF